MSNENSNKSDSNKLSYSGSSNSEYYYLGSWDKNGVPKYLDSSKTKEINPDLIYRIINYLPERSSVPTANPSYLTNTASRNIIIKSNDANFAGTDVYMTFLYEGAGYYNVVGYYVYPLNGDYTVPTKLVDGQYVPMTYDDRNAVDEKGKSILKKTVVFPNASLPSGYWTLYFYCYN